MSPKHRVVVLKIIAGQLTVTEAAVVATRTGEIIATNTIQPDRTYWRNTQKEPGRWPGSLT